MPICVRIYAKRNMGCVSVAQPQNPSQYRGVWMRGFLHIHVSVCVTHYTGPTILASNYTLTPSWVVGRVPDKIAPRKKLKYSVPGQVKMDRSTHGLIVAQEVELHRDTPKFCVRVIFDIIFISWCQLLIFGNCGHFNLTFLRWFCIPNIIWFWWWCSHIYNWSISSTCGSRIFKK